MESKTKVAEVFKSITSDNGSEFSGLSVTLNHLYLCTFVTHTLHLKEAVMKDTMGY